MSAEALAKVDWRLPIDYKLSDEARAAKRDPVKPLDMPGTFDTEPRNIGVGIETGYFFLRGHKRNNIIHPVFYWQVRASEENYKSVTSFPLNFLK